MQHSVIRLSHYHTYPQINGPFLAIFFFIAVLYKHVSGETALFLSSLG